MKPLLLVASLVAVILVFPPHASSASAHFSIVNLTGDPVPVAHFQGISRPAGLYDVNVVGGSPGFLNGTSGAAGQFRITPLGLNTTELVALSIQVTDSAGPSHSLSSLSDPALPDLVTDLNHSAVSGPVNPTVYPFNAAPAQYADSLSTLSLSEAALGGQPFDVLLVAPNPGTNRWWILDMSQEINNLDGITALSVTDIGAVPEPSPLASLFALALLLPRRRA